MKRYTPVLENMLVDQLAALASPESSSTFPTQPRLSPGSNTAPSEASPTNEASSGLGSQVHALTGNSDGSDDVDKCDEQSNAGDSKGNVSLNNVERSDDDSDGTLLPLMPLPEIFLPPEFDK